MAEVEVTITPHPPEPICTVDSDEETVPAGPSPSAPVPSTSLAVVPFTGDPKLEILVPDFKLTAWNPMRAIDFLGLARMPKLPQTDHVCKIKISTARRRVRRAEIERRLTGQNRLDEKKFHIAASQNDAKTIEQLLSQGMDASVTDSKNRTALHIAASQGHDKIVSILVKHGANPNMKDCIGNTPLHLAVCCNHLATVSVLLEAGTDPRSMDNAGRTPMHLAQARITVLQRELSEGLATHKVKDEVIQVADMMERYLRVRGDDAGVVQLTDLCHKLKLSNTKEELTSVNHLLEEFTSLSLTNPVTSRRQV